MNIVETGPAFNETDSLRIDKTPPPSQKNSMKYFMTVIVITVIKANYEGFLKADN